MMKRYLLKKLVLLIAGFALLFAATKYLQASAGQSPQKVKAGLAGL